MFSLLLTDLNFSLLIISIRRTIATTSPCMVIVAWQFSHGTKSAALENRGRLNLNLHADKDIENINLKIR